MVNAYIFSKDAAGTRGQVHSFRTTQEAWGWVNEQGTLGKNVIVAEGKTDILLAWRLFGANRGNDDEHGEAGKDEVGLVAG